MTSFSTFPLFTLLFIAMAGVTTGLAMAANVPVSPPEVKQPFLHPADDVSYQEDLRDDEPLSRPTSERDGKIQYISGGVSDSGMRAMDGEENAYDLKLLFVENGEYLANVNVTMTDSHGNNVLNTTTSGPVLLAKMPAGRYTLVAQTEDGLTTKRIVHVHDGRLASYVLRYPN